MGGLFVSNISLRICVIRLRNTVLSVSPDPDCAVCCLGGVTDALAMFPPRLRQCAIWTVIARHFINMCLECTRVAHSQARFFSSLRGRLLRMPVFRPTFLRIRPIQK